MLPRTKDVLVAWALGLAAIGALAALLTSCTTRPTEASEAFTAVEMALVDDTARWAGVLGVRVRGVITDERYHGIDSDGIPWEATGWYTGGVAYYNRALVAANVRLVPEPGCETAANVAAHEVAHAIYYGHDAQHWCCTAHMGASPTYLAPVAGLVCEGVATRCSR